MKPPCTFSSHRFKLGGWWYNCDFFVLSLWMLQKDYFLFCTSFFGLGIIMLRLRTAELPGNSYFPRRTIWLVCRWQRVQVGTLTKEKAYFTSSNCVFHSTWNSRQETKGLFKKQFQANYHLKSALKELWWKATTLFLWVFRLPFFPLLFLKRILEWNQPWFRRKVYWLSFLSFSFFSSLICELLKGHFLSLHEVMCPIFEVCAISVPQWFPWLRRIWFFLKY